MTYKLKCLLCAYEGSSTPTNIQEHVMNEHGYTQADIRSQTKRETDTGYVWTMPDGTDAYAADRASGNYLGGL